VSIEPDELLHWFRSQPAEADIELNDLSERFAVRPERLRDQLRRLVEQGLLAQSDPVPGFADANPSYRLIPSAQPSSTFDRN
jgi:hypothetical protein